ncbi:MAG: ABC transporter substrate-binding protein [Spirochaetes bacterium]|nr:ABC transporter substrate-binding protein [Spirochaetota bacterium]
MARKRFWVKVLKIALRLTVGAALIFSMPLVFTSCGGQVVERTDTLIIGIPSMPANLDPTLTNDVPSARVTFQIYDTLIDLDYDMMPRPNLATSWEWVDPQNPTQLRVFLRSGVFFHNGDELTASDVAFSLNRASVAPAISANAGMIQNATVVSDNEVLITLEQPFVPFINFLGHRGLAIVSERAITEMGVDAHSQAPVGSGPFRLTNIVAGDRLELTRWEHYWGGDVNIENMIFRILPDVQTRLIALETGEIDIMMVLQPQDMSRVQAHPDLRLFQEPTVGTQYIAFNVSRPPFDDIRVRHAVQYALDTEAMVQAVFLGAHPPVTGPLSPRVWASAADRLEPFPFNPDRARELLAEAGLSNGFSTTFMATQGLPQTLDIAEIMQNMLGQVGIDVTVQALEWGAFLEASNRGEPDIITISWITTPGDPDHGLFGPFHSSTWGGGNRAFFSDPVVDSLLEAGRRETDPVLRADIYYQIQRIIRDESPWVFLATFSEVVGVRNNVQNFRVSPNMIHRFWQVSLTG